LAAGLLGDVMCSPRLHSRNRGLTSKRREWRKGGEGRGLLIRQRGKGRQGEGGLLIRGVREGEGPTSKGDGRKGKKERGDGKGRGFP